MYAAQEPNAPFPEWVVMLALAAGALACVLLVVPYRTFDLDRFFAPKELALHVTALVAGVVALATARRLSLAKADVALIAWLSLSALSALFATNHWLAYRSLTVSVSGAVIFWSARRLGSAGFGPAFARLLAVIVVAGALTALAQAYGVKMEFAALNRAPGGTFGNRNFMAHITAAGVPLLVWCIAKAASRRAAVWWSVCLAICAAALVLSRTRAAWLALAIAMVLGALVAARGPVLFDPPRMKKRLSLALVSIGYGVVLALFLPNSLDWKSGSPYLDSVRGVVDYREGSGRGRVAQYLNSAKMAARHPLFGVGPGNWAVQYPKFARADDPSIVETTGMTANPWPSSDWMAALSERGVPAFAALVAFFFLLLGGALRVRYDAERSAQERLAVMAGAGVVLIAVLEGAFDAVLLLPTPTIFVFAIAGALLGAGPVRESVEPIPSRRWQLIGSYTAFALLACFFANQRIQAMRLYEIGTPASIDAALVKDPGSYRIEMRAADYFMSRGQCVKAHAHAAYARELFPNAPAPRHVLARCRS
jgi:O-antigen ligase